MASGLYNMTIPINTPTPALQPQAPDPYAGSVAAAKQMYPRLAHLPIALTSGTGAGESETYEPGDNTNPVKGHWNIQLRSSRSKAMNGEMLRDTVASESLHGLYATDPQYQAATKAFVASMTPQQLKSARHAYDNEAKIFGQAPSDSFEKWLPRVQAQEYIRGHLFQNVNPGWAGPKGEGGYTPQQEKQLKALKDYLMGK